MLQSNSVLSHIHFQHSSALKLTQNLLAICRKYGLQLKFEGRDPMYDLPTHHFIQLENNRYCDVYKVQKYPQTRPRLAPALVDSNQSFRTKRPAQTIWGCNGCTPSACCHSAKSSWELHCGKLLD